MLHIRHFESLLCEAGACPLHFDTKLEGKKVQFPHTHKKSFNIRQIESLLCEAGDCPLHFDAKLERIG